MRARHAVEQARVERNLSLAEEAEAILRVTIGRQAAEIIRLTSDVHELKGELYDQHERADVLVRQQRDLRAAVDASQFFLEDAFVQRDRALAARLAAEAHAAELHSETSRLRARVAVSAARTEYLEGRMEDLTAALQTARARTEQANAQREAERGRMSALEEGVAASASENRSLTVRLSRSAAEHGHLVERAAELERRLRLSEKAREDALLESSRRLVDLGDREAALALETSKGAQLVALAKEQHPHESASALGADTLASAYRVIEGSLRTARVEQESLDRENEVFRKHRVGVGNSTANSQLRRSIDRLGREVVRLFALKAEEKDPRVADREAPGIRDVEHASTSGDGQGRGPGQGRFRRAGRSRAPER